MGSSPHEQVPGSSIPPFRLDVQLHELLRPTSEPIRPSAPPEEGLKLPEPVFPQRPALLSKKSHDEVIAEPHIAPVRRQYNRETVRMGLRGWLYPYVKSRVLPGDFHPIIAYLFTEWKCNLDCHYYWARDAGATNLPQRQLLAGGFALHAAAPRLEVVQHS